MKTGRSLQEVLVELNRQNNLMTVQPHWKASAGRLPQWIRYSGSRSISEVKRMEKVIQWVDERKKEEMPTVKTHRSHKDPTADEAIGNVMREEKRNKCSSTKVTNTQVEKAANSLILEKALKSFDAKTILHIGGKSAFYFIGTAGELRKNLDFVEFCLLKSQYYKHEGHDAFVPVLKRKVVEIYPKSDPTEGVIIKTEGEEAGRFWFNFEYQKMLSEYRSRRTG